MTSRSTAYDLLTDLTTVGVTVALNKGRLRVVTPWPTDEVPEQVLELLRELKGCQVGRALEYLGAEARAGLPCIEDSQPLPPDAGPVPPAILLHRVQRPRLLAALPGADPHTVLRNGKRFGRRGFRTV